MKNKMFLFLICIFASSLALAQVNESSSPAIELQPVVIKSDIDKQASPLITAPGSIVKKERSSIRQNSPDSLSSSLGVEPGIDFTGGPRSQAELPQIRGLNSSRILILEDGVRQNFQSGHNGRVFSDFSLLESLEIVKGPWSSLYGSGAMGGVVSFRKSTAADFIRRTGQYRGIEFAVDAGSAAEAFGQRATAFAKVHRFEPLVSYHHEKSGDIRMGSGDRLPSSAEESNDLYSSLGYELGKDQTLNLKLGRYVAKAKTPLDPEQNTSVKSELGDAKTTKSDVVGEYQLARTRFDFHAKPFVRETEVKKARLSDGRTDVQMVQTRGIDTWNNLNWEISESFKSIVTTGLEYFRDNDKGSRDGGSLDSFPNGSSEQWGAYLQPTITWNKRLSLIPGVRYDSYRLEDSSGKTVANSGDKTSLKTYATYEYLPEHVVFLGWGQAYNAPRLQDVYISGQHFPGNFFVANPNLKPEIADTFEAGTKNQFKINQDNRLAVHATYFLTEARDFIARKVDSAGGTTTFENLDRVKLNGIELQTLWQNDRFGVGLSYGQVRSLNKGTGEPLADTMPDQWTGKLEYYLSDKAVLGTDLVRAEAQTKVPSDTTPTGGYFTEDFYASYTAQKTEIVLRVNNAFDRAYRKHSSAIDEVGRDFRLTASWVY